MKHTSQAKDTNSHAQSQTCLEKSPNGNVVSDGKVIRSSTCDVDARKSNIARQRQGEELNVKEESNEQLVKKGKCTSEENNCHDQMHRERQREENSSTSDMRFSLEGYGSADASLFGQSNFPDEDQPPLEDVPYKLGAFDDTLAPSSNGE